MRDKVFVAGVYGAGKTYFSKKLAEACSDHTFVSFDRNFYEPTILHPYSLTIPPIRRLWKQIKKHNKFVMDGVPCDTGRAWDFFHDYYEKHDCQVIMLKPDIDVWLKRLTASPWFNPLRDQWVEEGRPDIREVIRTGDTRIGIRVYWGVDIDKHIQNFKNFYEEWVEMPDVNGVLPTDTVWIDPDEPTETLIKKLTQ